MTDSTIQGHVTLRMVLSTLRSHLGLVVVLGLGVLLRAAWIAAVIPAHLNYVDAWGYAREAAGPLFIPHFYRPAGYSAFLAVAADIWPDLQATIVLQHLLGLGTAVLAYSAVLRLGQPRWVALVPAAVIALTGDVIYFEHTLLSEWFFMGLLVASLCVLAGAVGRPRSTRAALLLAVGAGLLLGAASTVRGAGMFVIPVFALALLLRPTAGKVARLAPAAVMTVCAAAVVLTYMGFQYRETDYWGYTDGRGWATYARAAPFADCSAFDPPKGTRRLCEKTDVRERLGPDHYMWDADSPALKVTPQGPPFNDAYFGRFGTAAITGQPTAYTKAVLRDLWRFVDPDGAGGFGQPPWSLNLRARNIPWEQLNLQAVEPLYGPSTPEFKPRRAQWVEQAQKIVRVHGAIVGISVLLLLLAIPFARGQRMALLVLGGSSLAVLVLSVATQEYNWRFAVPVTPLLVGAGAVGLRVLAGVVRGRVGSAREARAEKMYA